MNLLLQVQAGPLPDYNAQLHNDSAKQVEPAQTEAQAKVFISKARTAKKTLRVKESDDIIASEWERSPHLYI